jgi:hypothetical protein
MPNAGIPSALRLHESLTPDFVEFALESFEVHLMRVGQIPYAAKLLNGSNSLILIEAQFNRNLEAAGLFGPAFDISPVPKQDAC